jgi:hypothetical protein
MFHSCDGATLSSCRPSVVVVFLSLATADVWGGGLGTGPRSEAAHVHPPRAPGRAAVLRPHHPQEARYLSLLFLFLSTDSRVVLCVVSCVVRRVRCSVGHADLSMHANAQGKQCRIFEVAGGWWLTFGG